MANYKYKSDEWYESEPVTVTLGSVNIGSATVYNAVGGSWIGLASVSGKVGLNTGANWAGLASVSGSVKNAGVQGTPTTSTIGLFNSGNATVFVATNTFKILNLALSVDLAETLKFLSGTDYLAGNASVGMSLAAEGSLVSNGSLDSPVFIASGAAKGFVINSSATGAIGGSVTWLEE